MLKIISLFKSVNLLCMCNQNNSFENLVLKYPIVYWIKKKKKKETTSSFMTNDTSRAECTKHYQRSTRATQYYWYAGTRKEGTSLAFNTQSTMMIITGRNRAGCREKNQWDQEPRTTESYWRVPETIGTSRGKIHHTAELQHWLPMLEETNQWKQLETALYE